MPSAGHQIIALPNIARNDPAYGDNDYWRGRIWGPINFLVYLGMQRYDVKEARQDLIDRSKALLMKNWSTRSVGILARFQHLAPSVDFHNSGFQHLAPSVDFHDTRFQHLVPSVDFLDTGFQHLVPSVDFYDAEFQHLVPSVESMK